MTGADEFARLLAAASVAGPLGFELFDGKRNNWTDLLARLAYQPAGYARSHIEYLHTYLAEFSTEYARLDCVVSWQGVPVGAWPLAWSSTSTGERRISSNLNGAFGVVPPLLPPDMPEKLQKSGGRQWLGLLGQLAEAGKVEQLTLIAPVFSGPVPHWHRLLMEAGASVHCRHRAQADLTIDESRYHGKLRKSYKALINTARKHWIAHIDATGNEAEFKRFETLHLKVAGRRTRSEESWNKQFEAIVAGEAFAVYLADSAGDLVGASLFIQSRDEAIYAIGAYDRQLFDKPLAHLSLYEAIAYARQRGIQRLILGDRPYPGDLAPPSEKELQIGFFKEGFASELVLMPYFIVDTRKLRQIEKIG